jgi:choice-of-anchor C domain-containing protein
MFQSRFSGTCAQVAPALVTVLIGATTLLVSPAAHAQNNVLVNGSFESPNSTGILPISAGDTSLTGWNITSGSIDVISNVFWQAYSGSQSIDLDGNNPGTITQSFATVAGRTYTLSFAYANNPDNSTPTALVTVQDSAATPKLLFTDPITHTGSQTSAMNYTFFTGTFVADTASSQLTFASTDGGGLSGIALDAVSVTGTAAAPEPGSIALLGSCLLPLAGLVLRRR